MENPEFIKCEPGCLLDGEQEIKFEAKEEEITSGNLLDIKIEPTPLFPDATVKEETSETKNGHILRKLLTKVVDGRPDIERIAETLSEEQRKEISQECLDPTSNADQQEKPYKCDTCHKRLKSRSAWICHNLIHGGKMRYHCSVCGDGFPRAYMFKRHMLRHTGERAFKCKICNRSFMHRTSLVAHEMVHTGLPYQCVVCKRSFNRQSRLNKHMVQHQEGGSHACALCNKTFPLQSLLRKHVCNLVPPDDLQVDKLKGVAATLQGKRYVCDACGCSFTRPYSLKSHKTIHSGIKPFTCHQCGRSFARRHTLTCHMLLHAGKK